MTAWLSGCKLLDMKKIGAALAATVMLFSLAACSDDNYNLECDQGDQVEHDTDCGYVDDNNQWVWYSWVDLGSVSHSPDNWEPPAGVQIQNDEEGHSKPKVKTTKKSTKLKPATAPKIYTPPKTTAPKPATVKPYVAPAAPKPVTVKPYTPPAAPRPVTVPKPPKR